MSISDLSVAYHGKGNNCAQSVLLSCSDFTGIEDALAVSIAEGFGGGCRCGEICGSVSGGIMALGIACYKSGKNKKEIAALTKSYCTDFKDHFAYIRCSELKGNGKYTCDELIAYAAELAEKYINNL